MFFKMSQIYSKKKGGEKKMTIPIKPINPGKTFNIGSSDHLTQIQHKGKYIDIVDHFDKGNDPIDFHIITKINPDGSINTEY